VGKTSASFSTAGHELRAGAAAIFVRDGNDALSLNRLTSDGDIAKFSKDGTAVGSIGAEGGDLVIGTGTNCGLQFNDGNTAIRPFNIASNAPVDNAVDLGVSGTRFKDLYLSGGVYLGGTGAANKLDDYESGTFTPVVRGRSTAGTGTYTRQSGYYTKVGRTVTIHMDIGWSAHTGSGGMEITLPFATGGGYQAGGFMSYNSGMQYGTAAGDILSLWMDSSSSNMRVFYYNRTGTSATVNVPSSASEIHLHMIYNT
jgi:hypothetical protein